MQWDLGPYGLAVLFVLSFAFAGLAQLLAWRSATHWMWLVAGLTFFVCGAVLSEGLFGWATVEELQPNIDGLSLDETLLAVIPGTVVVVLTWYATRTAGPAEAA